MKLGILGFALVLTGCAGGATPPDPDRLEPTSTATSQVTPDPSDFIPPTGLIDDDTGEEIQPRIMPEWDEASRASVLEAAEEALATYAQPDLSHDEWWAEIEPLLTEAAREDYFYVDPDNIPPLGAIGDGTIIRDDSAFVAMVEVPTDIGRYHVLLIRKDGVSPWLVSRFTPIQDVPSHG